MGQPGRFGAPELVVLSRNLCWSLGRIGKRHLETVVIGAGLGNITFDEAVAAWMQGIRLALIRAPNDRQRLRRVTFVESDPERITFIQEAILGQRTQLAEAQAGLRIKYKEIPRPTLERIARDARSQARLKLQEERKSVASRRKVPMSDLAFALPPIHVSIRFEGKSYRISAITERLALPEREISIDNAIVDAARNELAESDNPTKQLEVARFLRELLIPADLGYFLTHDGPVNLTLDKTAAQIPWEMIAQPENTSSFVNLKPGTAGDGFLHSDKHLGTRRGVTRQLPFMSSMLPDPPPPAHKVLRVLVVGDPAEDARLPGAEAEGVEVASIFESFNSVYGPESPNRVEVIKLLGPLEASRTAVLRELMIRNYDVLHFTGRCVYDELDPTASGWLFSKGARLSPKELNRIDRIPRFVFSNAFGGTDSGIVLPIVSFAETFLARGVGNFIYPAWPVDDVSARQFALKLYAGLLGLKPKAKGTGYEPAERQPLNMAVREARLAVAAMPSGLKSWGAYQHYGSREFSFFAKK